MSRRVPSARAWKMRSTSGPAVDNLPTTIWLYVLSQTKGARKGLRWETAPRSPARSAAATLLHGLGPGALDAAAHPGGELALGAHTLVGHPDPARHLAALHHHGVGVGLAEELGRVVWVEDRKSVV